MAVAEYSTQLCGGVNIGEDDDNQETSSIDLVSVIVHLHTITLAASTFGVIL
jgi:hypothetical protein